MKSLFNSINSYFDKKKENKYIKQAIDAIGQDGNNLKYYDQLKGDKFIATIAIDQNGMALKFVGANLKEDEELVRWAINKDANAFKYASPLLRKDEYLIDLALSSCHDNFVFVSKEIINDDDKLNEIFTKYPQTFKYATIPQIISWLKKGNHYTCYKQNQEWFSPPFKYATNEIKKSKKVFMEAARQNVGLFKYADDSLKKDEDYIFELISENMIEYHFRDYNCCLDAGERRNPKLDRGCASCVNGLLINIPRSFRGDAEFMLKAFRINPTSIFSSIEPLRSNKEFVSLIAKQNGSYALSFSNKKFRKDEDVVLLAVNSLKNDTYMQSKRHIFELSDYISIRSNKEFMLNAIKDFPESISYVDESLINDKDFLLRAIKNNNKVLDVYHPSKKYRKIADLILHDEEFMYQVVSHNVAALRYFKSGQKDNKKIVRLAFEKDPALAYEHLSTTLMRNEDFFNYYSFLEEYYRNMDKQRVLKEIKRVNFSLGGYINEELKQDRDIIFEELKKGTGILSSINDSLMNSKEFICQAIAIRGSSLYYAPDKFKKDKEIALIAAKQKDFTLEVVDESLRKDKEVVLAAAKQCGDGVFEYLDESLKLDKEFMHKLLKIALRRGSYEYMKKIIMPLLKKDESLCLEVIKLDYQAFHELDEFLPKDKDFILRAIQANVMVFTYLKHESKLIYDQDIQDVKNRTLRSLIVKNNYPWCFKCMFK